MAEKKDTKTKAPKTEAPENAIMQKPDYLAGVGGNDAAAMSSGVGMSVPRVSAKGKQFRFINGEDEVKFALGEAVEVVVLGVVPEDGLAKTFYESGYQPGSTDPPDCSSWDGIRPDSWVSKPQSDLCQKCPNMVWGSATSMSGKKAKACKESKRLIVTLADDLEGAFYILTVTVSSLKALSAYGQFLAKNQVPFAACITQISFADSDFPQFEFEFVQYLEEADGKTCITRAIEKAWDVVVASKPQLPDGAEASAPKQIAEASGEAPPSAPASGSDMKDLLNKW